MKGTANAIGCAFLPWDGRQYTEGIRNRKVLIVGEAHYTEPGNHFGKTFTQEVIEEDVIQRANGRSLRYFTILQRLLGSEDISTVQGRSQFWNSVAFYNYVQALIYGTRTAPTSEQWESGKIPFAGIVEALHPDVMIITGNRLWGWLADGLKIKAVDRKGLYLFCHSHELKIPVAQIAHPSSSAFRYANEMPKIEALMKR